VARGARQRDRPGEGRGVPFQYAGAADRLRRRHLPDHPAGRALPPRATLATPLPHQPPEPELRRLGPAVWAQWVSGQNHSSRQPLEQINWRLPASLDAGAPRQNSPAWNDLFYKRTGVYGSEHTGGANLAFADGSVKFVSETISLLTLRSLSTKNGGEPVAEEY
jgi:prepilin-type processing-associated H-X9-DG protein